MNKNDIYRLISNVFGLEPEDISLEDDLYEDYNAESTDMIELKLQLEDLLKTKIDQDEFMDIRTIEELLSLVEDYSDEFLA